VYVISYPLIHVTKQNARCNSRESGVALCSGASVLKARCIGYKQCVPASLLLITDLNVWEVYRGGGVAAAVKTLPSLGQRLLGGGETSGANATRKG